MKLPKQARPRNVYLRAARHDMLASEAGRHRRWCCCWVCAGCGEVIALRMCDVDFLRRRVEGAPQRGARAREVHRRRPQLEREPHYGGCLVMTALAAAATGKCRDHLLWTAPHGGYLRSPGSAHALRRTAASLAISAGASPQGGAADARVCQRGHDAGRVRRFVRV